MREFLMNATTVGGDAVSFELDSSTAGVSLEEGVDYYLRIRANVGTRWFGDGPNKAITPGSSSTPSQIRGAFGTVEQVAPNRYRSVVYGELEFADGGASEAEACGPRLRDGFWIECSARCGHIGGRLPHAFGLPVFREIVSTVESVRLTAELRMIVLKRRPLKLVWFQKLPNFGDRLNPWLVGKICKRRIQSYSINDVPQEPHLMAVGSILGFATRKTLVWGTGFVSSEDRPNAPPASIHAIRGPLSLKMAQELGACGPRAALGDPALLVSGIYDPWVFRKRKLGIVPHYVDQNHPWIQKCRDAGILIIDVGHPIKRILRQIKSCEHILSSSLHGLICAEAYGVKTQWIELGDKVIGGSFKFRDHYAGCGYPGERTCKVSVETDPWAIMERATLKAPMADLKALRGSFPEP